jgi:hypothetical protein
MTKPTTFRFGEMLIEVGDGASPETFGAPCGLTTKAFNGAAQTQDTVVPDCDDPDAPAWNERAVTALSRDISGNGVLAKEFLETWDDWFSSGLSRNVHITIGQDQWRGAYVLNTFDITADLGQKLKVNIAMQSDGQVTRANVT